jgi:thiol-disulfide isomerase/thioredoxin
MNLRIPLLAASGVVGLGAFVLGQTSSPEPFAGTSYTFRRPVYNGFGLERLEDLRGKPVLIEFWSYQCPPCVASAIPETLRLQSKYGEDLHLLFAETGGASENQVLSFALSKGWLGSRAMWTTELPLVREGKDVPYFALLSAEGDIVLEGIATERASEIETSLDQLVKDGEKAPREVSRELAKALAESSEGNFARAHELALKELEEAGPEGGAKAQEAKRVLEQIDERLDLKVKQLRWMLENGYPIEAGEAILKLGKSLKGWQERENQLAGFAEELETPEMKLELEAQKALQKIERKVFEDPDVRWVKNLQRIVEKYPRTKTAERAKKLAKIAAI